MCDKEVNKRKWIWTLWNIIWLCSWACGTILSWVVYVLYNQCVCAQLCLTLCDPMDCSPSGSSVHGIFQARILEWVANYSSRGWMFLTQGLNPRLLCLLHWQVDSLPLAPPRQFSVFSDNVLKVQRNKRNSLLGKRFKITIENTLINYFRKNTCWC